MVFSQDACTSGSATSVDVRDLPFDMPKLRRRLRIQQSTNESVSQASSNQSVVEADREGKNIFSDTFDQIAICEPVSII